ncbi:uncharacterized protein MYCFIDRAFT_123895 [Pseudocercospora fijiensis CIRAD86]
MPFQDVVRALYDYPAQSDEELDIKEGDLLLVLEKSSEDDWWKCKKKATSEDEDEPEGLVPNNYVEPVKPAYQAKALYDYSQQTEEELSFAEGAQLHVYDTSDPDWTLVGSRGQYGFAPAIYLERISSTAAAASAPAARQLAPPPPSLPSRPPEDHGPIPGEEDYPAPGSQSAYSPEPAASNPAAQIAGLIAQRTGGAAASNSADRAIASPPLPTRPQYTPEESDDEPAPSLPRRPPSQHGPASPSSVQPRYASPRSPEPPDDALRSPGGFHLYNVHEMISHMGKNKKMPTTLGINLAKGIIMISPEKSKDGPSKEWTAEKLAHYSIEGKHVFVELVRPSKSIDFHAGAKDTAQEIVSALGELAGAVRQEGLREVLAASAGSGAGGMKKGQMLYEFMAQGDDEVTVAAGDEVIILDDSKSEEWWMVRRMKNGKEGVVPSSYVEITGTIPHGSESITGLDAARSTVEQNRLEEQRLAKEAARDRKRDGEVGPGVALPERHSSLAGDTRRTSMRKSDKRSSKDQPKSKPNESRVRTWTDRSGTFKVEAEFIGLREGKIHLHKLNGVKIAVPVAKMAVEDLEYVERATGASLDEDKPLSDIKRRNTQRQKDKERANGTRGAGASVQKDEYDWFDFFLQCNIDPHVCQRYAQSFSRDNMGPEILPEIDRQLLRTLGLKEGDILRVMKFLDNKYGRTPANQDGEANGTEGGLFAGPGGVLKNNTRKGRPAPPVQTNDVVDENAFKQGGSPAPKSPAPDAKATPLTSAPARQATGGFDDDAWDVKPARSQTPTTAAAPAATPSPARAPSPPKPLINDDIASLSISAPPLQPTPAAQPPPPAPVAAPVQSPPPAQPQQPQGANQAIFDKIAALAPAARQQQSQPAGQRPAPPAQQGTLGLLGLPPPPRAASAPGFPPQQQSSFSPPPLQPQLTGYQPQLAPPGQSMAALQQQQQYQQLQPQQTAYQPQQGYGQGYQQQLVNGVQTGSPFADPPRGQFQATPSGLSNSFTAQQPGFQATTFNISQPTGMNGFGAQATQAQAQPQLAPQLPPQQTGGVFGPSQPLQAPVAAPLIPQKTGPPPAVRFGVQRGAKALMPQPTGRANLSKATPQNPFGF